MAPLATAPAGDAAAQQADSGDTDGEDAATSTAEMLTITGARLTISDFAPGEDRLELAYEGASAPEVLGATPCDGGLSVSVSDGSELFFPGVDALPDGAIAFLPAA